jgi:2-oxoglutarate/2-oxoacid ferredoxin oxidoreductase subunit alpha
MNLKEITWKIGGPAGFGIMSTGLIFSKAFSKKGYNVIDGNEYPSLIQGGHNTYTTGVSSGKIYSLNDDLNILVVLDRNSLEIHNSQLSQEGYVIYDSEDFKISDFKNKRNDINYLEVPLLKLTKNIDVPKLMRNNVALGASFALTNIDLNSLKISISDYFKYKGKEIIDLNIKAAELGYKFVKDKLKRVPISLPPVTNKAKMLLTGNDATFLGAVKAGCKFYAAYPMTPSTSILHSFAAVENEMNIVVKHAESEIAVVNMAMGASFAGVRSMLATSGGGFSLMNEGLSAAAMTETPLVMVLCQRPAPATGLPTWTEQGDMLFAKHASHGEFLRVVMAPGDPQECFYLTRIAFNLAEKYQIPVIILLDKYLSEGHFSYPKFDNKEVRIDRGKLISAKNKLGNNYQRYKITRDGISSRALIGLEGGLHIANTDEHDQYGYSEENAQNRKNMVDKRFKKIEKLIGEVPPPNMYGPPEAEATIWSWGSCKGPILEAIKVLNKKTNKVNFYHFNYLYPFDSESVKTFMDKANINIVVENNKTSQLSKLIMMYTGKKIANKVLKYSGRQFLPEEIISAIDNLG